MSTKDTLTNLGLLVAGGAAIAAAAVGVGKGSRAIRGMRYALAYGGDNDSTVHIAGTYAPYSKAVDAAKKVAKRAGRTVEVREQGYDLVAFVEPDGRVDDGGYGKKGGSAAREPHELDFVRAGDKVTIVDRFGKEHTGKAVMHSSHGGWVLNMGGRYGTPGLVDERNFVRATRPKAKAAKGSASRFWRVGERVQRSGVMGAGHYGTIEGYAGNKPPMVLVRWDGTRKAISERADKLDYPMTGSGNRDGSYEATLMFDADEDDPQVIAQHRLQEVTGQSVRASGGKNYAALQYFNPEVVTRQDAAGEPCQGGSFATRDSVMRALTTKPGHPIPGPSLKTLDERLNLRDEEGKSLRHFMQAGKPRAALDYANTLMGGEGIEYAPSSEDGPTQFTGLDYVNMGDTYDTTLIYDRKKRRFVVGARGDLVEREPRRFGG